MTTYAFFFDAQYNLGNSYITIEAESVNEAIEHFRHARRQVTEGMPDSEHRWAACLKLEGDTEAIVRHQEMTHANIHAPLEERRPHRPAS